MRYMVDMPSVGTHILQRYHPLLWLRWQWWLVFVCAINTRSVWLSVYTVWIRCGRFTFTHCNKMIKKFTYVASHIVFVMTCGIMWTRGGQFTFIHCNKTIKKLTNVDACIMFVTICGRFWFCVVDIIEWSVWCRKTMTLCGRSGNMLTICVHYVASSIIPIHYLTTHRYAKCLYDWVCCLVILFFLS